MKVYEGVVSSSESEDELNLCQKIVKTSQKNMSGIIQGKARLSSSSSGDEAKTTKIKLRTAKVSSPNVKPKVQNGVKVGTALESDSDSKGRFWSTS